MKTYIGLTSTEATKKLAEFGPNILVDRNKVTLFDILLRQIKGNFIIYLLFAASIMSFSVGKTITAWTILAVIFMVVIVGFIQEYKAEQAISALKKMIMSVAIVIRDGAKKEIPTNEIVPGDIVVLRLGEKVPADGIILDEKEVRVNESALTGEADEVKKDPVKDENPMDSNQVFMGTYIVNGKAIFRVTHTGMNTRFGQIANLITESEKQIPLRNKINRITKQMVIIAIFFSIVTALVTLYRADTINTTLLIEVLILAIAMSVSAFPEGFPVVLISTLAMGAKRMADHNAIVNRMSTIETLGETTVICTDKTGTITAGEMTVRNIYIHPYEYAVSGVGYMSQGEITQNGNPINLEKNSDLKQLLLCAVLCNDSQINKTGTDHEYDLVGTPTEGALLILAAKEAVFVEDLGATILGEIPFNSERKMMSVMIQRNSEKTVYAKGAPEVLIERCTKILWNGEEKKLTGEIKTEILSSNETQTSKALRTIAFAYKPMHESDKNYDESDLIFIGSVAMEDPPRHGVKDSLAIARRSGITVKLITGDNRMTAVAIAREVGIEGDVLEGYQIEEMSDEELTIMVPQTAIFARVKPEHKLRIVKALKENNETVAMTGDGVNDAPALKEAHIGIAMGKNGTDVSRSVADLVLKDDDFTTIIDAIQEGRTIFNNLRKFTSYQLSCNGAELLILFVGTLLAPYFGWQVPILVALQILFMNLVTDNLPAIALGLNPTSADIMEQTPRKGTNIFTPGLVRLTVFTAIIMAAFTLILYYLAFNVLDESHASARTTALFGLILIEIAGAFVFRSFRKKVLNRSPLINPYLFYASLISLMLTFVIIYSPVNHIFETTAINITNIIMATVSAFFFITLYDGIKAKRGVLVRDVQG